MPPRIRGNVVGFRVKKKDPIVGLGPLKKAATYFPTDVVSSAQTGLTSLFGMVRGEPRRYNRLGFMTFEDISCLCHPALVAGKYLDISSKE